MQPLPSLVEGVSVESDLTSGQWLIRYGGQASRLRPWTWGERRRLVSMATAAGKVDADRLLPGVLGLLTDPEPAGSWCTPVAVVCLQLLGIPGPESARPLRQGELIAVRELGWFPSDLDRQPASDVDALVQQLGGSAVPVRTGAPRIEEGWTRIEIARGAQEEVLSGDSQTKAAPVSGGDAGLGAMLAGLLDTIAIWAGLEPQVASAPAARPRTPQTPDTVAAAPPVGPGEPGGEEGLASSDAGAASRSSRLAPTPEPPSPVPGLSPAQPGLELGPNRVPGTARLRKRPRDRGQATRRPLPPSRQGEATRSEADVHALSEPSVSQAAPMRPLALPGSPPSPLSTSGRPSPSSTGERLELHAAATGRFEGLEQGSVSGARGWPRRSRPLSMPTDSIETVAARGAVTFPDEGAARSQRLDRATAWMFEGMEEHRKPSGWSSEAEAAPRGPRGSQWPAAEGMQESLEAESERSRSGTPPTASVPDPFALSAFEEQLADVLERAAEEGGIDLP